MVFSLSGTASVVYAANSEENTSVTIKADLSNSDYAYTVEQLFENPKISDVNVIDTSLASTSFNEELPGIVPFSNTYYVASGEKEDAGTYTGSTILAKAQGTPQEVHHKLSGVHSNAHILIARG